MTMNDINKKASKEAAVKATDFVTELCKIADKYEFNRTAFIEKNAMIFFGIAMANNFDEMDITEREETNNE